MAVLVGQYGAIQITDSTGKPLPGGTAVNINRTTGGFATIYTDLNGTTTAVNPVTLDNLGNLIFFAPPGTYSIQAVLQGFPQQAAVVPVPSLAPVSALYVMKWGF